MEPWQPKLISEVSIFFLFVFFLKCQTAALTRAAASLAIRREKLRAVGQNRNKKDEMTSEMRSRTCSKSNLFTQETTNLRVIKLASLPDATFIQLLFAPLNDLTNAIRLP